MKSDQIFFVLDVESIGLHGEGFAVGWTVQQYGKEIDFGIAVCEPEMAQGYVANLEWVKKNCPKINILAHERPVQVRDEFWLQWQKWKTKGAIMASDCAWPVEARFLIDCVNDLYEQREWGGPYPLIDIGSVLFANGVDPLTKFPREENELPEHDPLADARHSARILNQTLYVRSWELGKGECMSVES